jgi:MFS family permease
MLGCLSAGLVNSAFFGTAPMFGLKIGLTVFQISWLMTATVFGGLSIQWILGVFSDRFDRTLLLLIVSSAFAIGSIFIMLHTGAAYSLLLIEMGLLGGLMFAVYPLSVARAHDVFEAGDALTVSSALLFCYSAGAVFGPIFATTAMALLKNAYGLFVFWSFVGFWFALSILYLVHHERVATISVDKQVAFVPMKSTSQVAMVLDPRSRGQQDRAGLAKDSARQKEIPAGPARRFIFSRRHSSGLRPLAALVRPRRRDPQKPRGHMP